jgi:hypothetical protein
MAVSLFVSHAPADDAFAQALTQTLIDAGIDAHAETFGPDQQSPRAEHEIILRDCSIFIPVLSRAAISSPRARSEARHFYDVYHDDLARFMLPVLVEPLELEEIWPFLQEYQRIEGPPDEKWSSDALIAGVLQWVTLVIPARARTPSGALRQTGGPVLFQGYSRQTGAPISRAGMGLQTRPLGEALIAVSPDRALQAMRPTRNLLVITLIIALVTVGFSGLLLVALLRGQTPQPAAILQPIATATAAAPATMTSTTTTTPAPTATSARVVTPPTATPLPAVQAAFVRTDATTGGTWNGVYGSQGYLLAPNDSAHPYSNIPGYALVNVSEAATYVWVESTTDQRAPQKPPGAQGWTDRIAACWYSGQTFALDIGVTDGQTHQIAFYFLDWDGYGSPAGRVERVDAVDATSGVSLDSRLLGQPSGDPSASDQFNGGKYVVWNVRGHVRFTITNLNSNAVLSGVFFA